MAGRVGDRPIIQRRMREAELEKNRRNVSWLNNASSRAEWEDRGFKDAHERQVLKTMAMFQEEDEDNLHSRRVKLAELYNAEMQGWKQECLNNVETPEQRKTNMIRRAKELKARRENERMNTVREKKLQQYREQCDDLRLLDSKHRVIQAVDGRASQVEEKRQQELAEQQCEKKMTALWEQGRQKKIEREERDKAEAAARNEEVKEILDLQVKLYNERVDKEHQMKKEEDKELIALWREQELAEIRKEKKLKIKAINRAAEVKQFNRERSAVKSQEYKKEREYDLRLLELALEREAAAEAKERALLEQFKQEAIAYQEMLKRQMAIEAEDLSYLDEIRKRMEDEVWEKRDAVHNAEAKAREDLLKAVLKSREDEIARKIEEEKRQVVADKVYMAQCKREAEEALQREIDAQKERADLAMKHRMEIEKQMKHRRALTAQEQQESFLELKRMQLAEKQHQDLVSAMSKLPMENRNRRKTAEWYFNS